MERRSMWLGARWILCAALASGATACVGTAEGPEEPAGEAQLTQASSSCAITPIAGSSLFVTNPTVMSRFPLQKVLDHIVSTGSNDGLTSLHLYQQMFDTLNKADAGVTSGPHCDDHPLSDGGGDGINGFPVMCPRQEGFLATTDPFAPDAGELAYIPLGLVNRFDLAPANGANCGQYRIVYGLNTQNFLFRTLIIFEAVLRNPNTDGGLAACLPVAQFWDNLSKPDAGDIGPALESFYFNGLHGFQPVVQAQNYGLGGGTNTGQIRTNMFLAQLGAQEWELREFRLSQKCRSKADAGVSCSLTANNTFDRNNPFGPLFAGTDPQSQDFQTELLSQVKSLSASTVAQISMNTAVDANAGESPEQDLTNNYLFQGQNNSALLSNITAKLQALGIKDITAQNILDRATTQSCAGCHEVSLGHNLGGPDGGLIWPFSNGFTQIDENRTLSPALQTVFLPARATTLVNFLNAHCQGDGGTAQVDPTLTVGGQLVGAAN